MFTEAVRQSFPCFAYVDFLALRAGYATNDISGDACKMRNKTEQVEEDNPLSLQNLSFSTANGIINND